MKKQQSYFTQIREVVAHPNADRLEIAKVKGWQSVVPKDQYKTGDWILFVEIDSILPRKSWNQFLFKGSYAEDETIWIKNANLRDVPSQGVCFPIEALELVTAFTISELTDTDTLFGIEHYTKPISAQLSGVAVGSFPTVYGHKADEENLLSYPELLEEIPVGTILQASTKYDGSPASYILDENDKFRVCSRNLELKESESNSFWKAARQYEIEKFMRIYRSTQLEPKPVVLQGEIYGESIQKNPLGVKGLKFVAFNLREGLEYANANNMRHLLPENIPTAQIVGELQVEAGMIHEEIIEKLQKLSNELKYPNCKPAEGIVVRPMTNIYSNMLQKNWSCKVINQNYKD